MSGIFWKISLKNELEKQKNIVPAYGPISFGENAWRKGMELKITSSK
jgi:hypothetical protein